MAAAVKSGSLQKLSGSLLRREWKPKTFVLYQDGQLVYNDQNYNTNRHINIKHGCHRIDYGNEVEADVQNKVSGRIGCLFSINCTEKTYFLLADSEPDARDWVQKLRQVHQHIMAFGGYHISSPPVQQINQPGLSYLPSNAGYVSYPSNQVPYPGNPGMSYHTNQPYPVQAQTMYPGNHPGMPMQLGPTYHPHSTMYNHGVYQPQQYVGYQATPHYYQTQPAAGYPVYQQQVQQSRGGGGLTSGLSSRRGLMAGAAGGALAGGLIGFGMGRTVGGFGGGFGGSFDSCDSDFGGDCDFGGCD